MRRQGRPVAFSLIWTLIGAVALVLTTAGITVVVASVRTNAITSQLLGQIDSLSDDNAAAAAARSDLVEQNQRLIAQNQHLIRQNARQREQLDALVRYLRDHGFAVPRITGPAAAAIVPKSPAAPSGASPNPRPRQPRPPLAPASPVPTTAPAPTATPNPGLADLTCTLAPMLCPGR